MKGLLVRLRALLRMRVSELGAHDRLGGAHDRLGLPCATCGEPATGWRYVVYDRGERRVIDGYATCAAHSSRELPDNVTETRAG
jgi:hypothetical protein